MGALLVTIRDLDRQTFLLINRLPHPFLLNIFFLIFDCLTYAGIAWGSFCLLLIILGNKKYKSVGVLGLSVVIFTTIVEGLLIKTILLKRLRPFEALRNVVTWGIKPTSYSFPSGQVANVFAVVTLFSLVFKNFKLTVSGLLFGFIIGLGRVYLGVHYPTDIIGGALIGAFCGYTLYLVTDKIGFLQRFTKSR
jgi:undecaprenyl-diphosphatase